MIDINNLTAEQLVELQTQLEAKGKADAERIKREKEAYKQLVDATVREQAKKLQQCSDYILQNKESVFSSFETILKIKSELYGLKSGQQTNSFTSSDGMVSIRIGNRVNEGWDDTVNEGIAKVKEFVSTMARDENSAALVDTVMGLLAKDKEGNLKANKVLELERLAVKTGDKGFLEGISIIKDSYRPSPSCKFVEVRVKNEHGFWVNVPLSMSSIEKF